MLLKTVLENAELTINIEIKEETENKYKVENVLDIKYISRKPYYLVK